MEELKDTAMDLANSPDDKYMGVKTGVVKSFGEYSRPGFGHIYDSNNNEYFIHYTDIVAKGFKNLARGQHVKFHGFEGEKGLYAKEVSVINV
jgi:CspA family cold shock protein